MIQSYKYDWINDGDMLVGMGAITTKTGTFIRNKKRKFSTALFVGPPLTSPAMPGSYYNIKLCIDWCNADVTKFSSRVIS